MKEAFVSINSLTVSFGEIRALDRVTLELSAGPVGLLGPNGAGKTTLLRVLLGHCVPGAGEVTVAGHDPGSTAGCLAIRREVGYMPEGDCLMPGMNAVDLVSYLGRFSGMMGTDAMTRAHEVLDYVGLEESRYRDVSGYSVGMKQRLKLAQALVHDPPLILLDEPTNGLDPKGRMHMLELIEELGHQYGKSLLVCSHLLPDIERTCEHVIVLNKGQVVESGTIADMTRTEGLVVRVRMDGDEAAFSSALGARDLTHEGAGESGIRVQLPEGAEDADAVFSCAQEAGVILTGVEVIQRTLEDAFMALIEEPDGGVV